MKDLYIGSGDVKELLSGKQTKGYHNLMTKFISNDRGHYNALLSPIDALRTGAILEERYNELLDINWYDQVKVTCKEFDVLKCSLDFAKLSKGNVIEFEELKTCNFDEFINISDLEYVQKKFKNNYNQVQFQLLCTGLDQATIVFMCVYSYEDDENWIRTIEEKDIKKFTIKRDKMVISKIMERATIFQTIKNNFEL